MKEILYANWSYQNFNTFDDAAHHRGTSCRTHFVQHSVIHEVSDTFTVFALNQFGYGFAIVERMINKNVQRRMA